MNGRQMKYVSSRFSHVSRLLCYLGNYPTIGRLNDHDDAD